MFALALRRTALPARKVVNTTFTRLLSTEEPIPSDDTRQAGRRKTEMEYTGAGSLYNRDPIVPPVGSGTKENPIMVPSGLKERTVGFEDPETHAIYWFNLQRGGKLHYIEKLNLYFKMMELEGDQYNTH